MFLNYANSTNNTTTGYINKNTAVEINSCGTYRLSEQNYMETCRPEGRTDYQLIYIESGIGYFYFNHSNTPTTVHAGNIVVFKPYEYQKYEYYGKDNTNIYWIHFTGNNIENLFSHYNLSLTNPIISSGTESFYAITFEQIISELQNMKEFYEESVALLFSHIIMHIGRYNNEQVSKKIIQDTDIYDVIAYFREHYQDNINVEAFIKDKGYGTSTFFKNFKAHTGRTPLQYLLHIRISYAKTLLETTNYPVSEIASIVGYSNALYFSRLFHKHVGLSPTEYRTQQITFIH